MSKKAIDIMLWEEGFYPFSFKFDLKKSINSHKKDLELLEFDSTSESILKHSQYFNLYFKAICKALEKTLSKSRLHKSLFIELIIADLNRSELLVSEHTKRTLSSRSSLDIDSLSNIYIQKSEFQNTTESSWGLIDSAIDTAILNLNYLKYVKFSEEEKINNELEQVDIIKNLSTIGSSYNVIKQEYDRIIWGGYKIENEGSTIKLIFDSYHLMLSNAALTRLSRNIASTQYGLIYSPDSYADTIKFYNKTRKFQEIKSVEKTEDKLTIKYQAKKKKPSYSYLEPVKNYVFLNMR
ncbi:hypothetical protein [Haliscomenobacter sp.]|uniref:hypothetical protein n=1 Tax=Haliscomenobacter sp. TaxID=2717303 RepID=UPI0035935AD9